jgi:hypothetical protein
MFPSASYIWLANSPRHRPPSRTPAFPHLCTRHTLARAHCWGKRSLGGVGILTPGEKELHRVLLALPYSNTPTVEKGEARGCRRALALATVKGGALVAPGRRRSSGGAVTPAFVAPNKSPNKSRVFSKLSI